MRANLQVTVYTLAFAITPFVHSILAQEKQSIENSATQPPNVARPNVLFIAVDDLRPAMGCYGDDQAITPNLDRLARRGILFRRAYCQQAVCSPSRLSLITGRRPDTTRVWDLKTHFRDALPDAVTLPELFRRNGYHTRSIGKILHGSGPPAKDPPSWSEPPLHDRNRDPNLRYSTAENLEGEGLKRAASEMAEVEDEAYMDGLVCRAAIKAINDHAWKGRNSENTVAHRHPAPFFLAVGFFKPHLPFCAPKKYWDLYDRDAIALPIYPTHPKGAPELAIRSWMELEGYTDIPKEGTLSLQKTRELRHGYYACVSYIDSLVGRLLDQLESTGLADNTIVCLWGDHGFHLGEQGLWTKANNYELSARVPLLLCGSEKIKAGSQTDALVELVDLYPTLAELCGLKTTQDLEGISLVPLLERPQRAWKKAVFTQYPRARDSHRHQAHGDFMGYAVRTDLYRYIEWRDWQTREVVARELYDQSRDPDETINLAADPDMQTIVADLSSILKQGWRAARP